MNSDETDVVVVGGGIHGAGVLQAAAAAGHAAMLLERGDPAAGTSSRSSKLIHGGLRYLETFQLRLVRESLRERRRLLAIAPHLVELVPFHIPVYRTTSRRPWKIRAGLSLYAMLGGLRASARFRKVPRRDWDSLDGLALDGLQAVYRYFDGQTDDAQLTRAVLASAEELGAQVRLGAELRAAVREGEGWRVRWSGRDGEGTVHARVIVNAAGPWANIVLDRVTPVQPRREVDLVGGTHIELEGLLSRGIYYTEAPSDRRAVFVMPWKGHILVGTTEQPYAGDPALVAPLEEEIAYLEETLHRYFPEHRGKRLAAWAGLRVLPKGAGRAFSRPREVILCADDAVKPRFLSIYGGKLTGYRLTAERVLERLERTLPRRKRIANTRKLKLPEIDDAAAPAR